MVKWTVSGFDCIVFKELGDYIVYLYGVLTGFLGRLFEKKLSSKFSDAVIRFNTIDSVLILHLLPAINEKFVK